MRWFRDISIRHKVTLLLMDTAVVDLLLLVTGLFLHEFGSARRALVGRMHIRAEIVAANATSALLFNNPKVAEQILTTLKGDTHLRAAVLYSREPGLLP